ncbi:unnamed protein product [Didymodactylos carnosus]|uniref:Uncharacterized protein n=1 Tax=Didymodactylos carnosus TaxID=1234261 RepID=A0A813W9Z5_9BILA|nr:unnamed protein product [Didymodactylos carnosus]CAF0848331.1 unnamed protein product [Didymodactylos carnosus]CAF3539432.1 unnamed protein product [Didymodactylos carnosus]CAF3635987.1 unnamed protein product [Didymodactylos carnosus]
MYTSEVKKCMIRNHKKRSRTKVFRTVPCLDGKWYVPSIPVHSQFCGRSGTPSDVRYDDQKLRKSRIPSGNSERRLIKQQKDHKSECSLARPLSDFFGATEQQITRVCGTENSSDSIDLENIKAASRTKPNVTLGVMCRVALTIGDKMAQSKEKVGLEAIRGFRLPSAHLQYESYEHHPMSAAAVLGEREESIRSRLKRQNSGIISPPRPCTAASTSSKSRPDSVVLNSTDSISGDRKNIFDREDTSPSVNIKSAPTSSLKSPGKTTRRQHPLNVRIGETLVRSVSDEMTYDRKTNTETPSDHDPLSPSKQMFGEMADTDNLTGELVPRPTPDVTGRSSGFTYSTDDQLMIKPLHTRLTSSEDLVDDKSIVQAKGNYKLIKNSATQVYKTVDSSHERHRQSTSQQMQPVNKFSELNLAQLELLENYDPVISEKIGAAFIPIQILARPKDAADVCSMTISEIEQKYPKKDGRPVFNLPRSHTSIDITQTLQLTKSKCLPARCQTVLKRKSSQEEMKKVLNIVPYEKQRSLVVRTVVPPTTKSNDTVRHANSTRTSWKNNRTNSNSSDDKNYLSVLARTLEDQWIIFDQLKEEERMQLLEKNLSVLNIRTKQEVAQMRKSPTKKHHNDINHTIRLQKKLPTIVGNDRNQTQRNKIKQQRLTSSVFLTQDSVRLRLH